MKLYSQLLLFLIPILVTSAIAGNFSPLKDDGTIASSANEADKFNKLPENPEALAETAQLVDSDSLDSGSTMYAILSQETPSNFAHSKTKRQNSKELSSDKKANGTEEGVPSNSRLSSEPPEQPMRPETPEKEIEAELEFNHPVLDGVLMQLLLTVLHLLLDLVDITSGFVLEISYTIINSRKALPVYCIAVFMIVEGYFLRHSKALVLYLLFCFSFMSFNGASSVMSLHYLIGTLFLIALAVMISLMGYTTNTSILKKRLLRFKRGLLDWKDDKESSAIPI